jgi:hypothetical protein
MQMQLPFRTCISCTLFLPIYAVSGTARNVIGRMLLGPPHSPMSGLRTKRWRRIALPPWEIDVPVSRDSQSRPALRSHVLIANPQLVAFHLDHEIGEFMRTVEQNLVRHLGRNTNDIAR